MARLGIDFGTTNTVAVIHDRGMFSVVLHETDTGAGRIVQELFPSAILVDKVDGSRTFGIEADRRFGQLGSSKRHVFIPSIKRHLRSYAEGGSIVDEPSGTPMDVASMLTEFLRSLAASIRASQSLKDDEPLETVITWPANANGAQRYITRKCFREAGFQILDTLNEPTASAIELADWLTARGSSASRDHDRPHAVAVFDLGGGTFDASVVWIDGTDFHVLSSLGIGDLGGDDFDDLLLDMFLEKLQIPAGQIGPITRHALLRQARSQKETLSAGHIKSLMLNPADFGLDGRPVSISTAAYMDRIRPILAPAVETLARVIADAATREPRIKEATDLSLYLVGGSSKLPLVAKMVAERFPGSRIVLTDKPFTSVAMGAAICATERVTYRDVFARHFGLIRLRDHGSSEQFDTIFPAGTPIPRKGEPPLERHAWYHPRHNVGHLRYLECTGIGDDGMPSGDVRHWSDILFPYDPSVSLTDAPPKGQIIATDRFGGEAVCEVYRCDSDGAITVELRRPARQDVRAYEIFHD